MSVQQKNLSFCKKTNDFSVVGLLRVLIVFVTAQCVEGFSLNLAIHSATLLVAAPCLAELFFPPSQCNYLNQGVRIVANCRQRGLAHINLHLNQLTEVLDLSENNIEGLRANQFRDEGLLYLQDLILRQNSIHEVDKASFHGLHRLTYIDLSHNAISSLPHNLFSTNTQLNTLKLSHNPLKQVNEPLGAYLIQMLDVSSCSLTQVPHPLLTESKQLQRLNMADNLIKQVDTGMFKHLTSLQLLHLERNPITCSKDTELLKLWLLEKQIDSDQFCFFTPPSNNGNPKLPPPLIANTPPPHLFAVNNVAPAPSTDKRPWHQHWAFPVLGVSLPIINLIFLITLLVLLRRYAARQSEKELYAPEESLPPYI